MKIILITPLLLILGCSSLSRKPVQILHWSEELQSSEPYALPFVSSYKSSRSTIIFVAAEHTSDPQSPTFQTIKQVVGEQEFEAGLVEMFTFEEGPSPQDILDEVATCEKTEYSALNCAEPHYAIARLNGKLVFGGEPSGKEVLEHLESLGYTQLDYIGFEIVRLIPFFVGKKKSETEIRTLLSRHLEGLKKLTGRSYTYTLSDISEWYHSRSGKDLIYADLKSGDLAPDVSPASNFFQKLRAEISFFRNEFIVQTILKLSQSYKRLLVVYGGGHRATQRDALEQLFGKPVYRKYF